MISKLRQFTEVLVSVDQRLGLKKLIKYLLISALVILSIPVLRNPRDSIKDTLIFLLDLQNEIEGDRFRSRDLIMRELNPLLRELRAASECDRVVYYEYHNSLENEAGIPFRFVDLVQQAPRMGLPPLRPLDNINVSRFAELYMDMIEKGYVINRGDDQAFQNHYPGYTEISNGSKMQMFCNIPGIHQTLGIVVLEWIDKDSVNWDRLGVIARRECLRINATVMEYSHKKR